MSDVSLPYHRRFRPSRISDFVGNVKIKKSVMAVLRSEGRPQVILLQGHAGCGKTTMARLIAKEYLCENRDDFTGACGQCYNCKSLEEYIENGDSGNLMNVREIDVTDSNKKQDIDELLEDASIPSFDGSWKIYILDEVHALSIGGQTRLLKSLEEPAEKVLMILCTTDPEKLLPTIISRCQYTFKVSKPTRDELSSLLQKVCTKEGVKYDARSLSLICAKGEFVPRKSLIALEQVVKEKNEVTYNSTVDVLNIVADKFFFDFFDIILQEKIEIGRYVHFIGKVKESMELKSFADNLISFTVRGIYVNSGIQVDALDMSEIKQYKKVFAQFNPVDLTNLLDLLLNMKTSLDIEAKLLLMGYSGIKRNTNLKDLPSDELGYLTDVHNFTASNEKKEGDNNYIENITITEEEKQEIITNHSKEVSADDIAKLFGGVRVYED